RVAAYATLGSWLLAASPFYWQARDAATPRTLRSISPVARASAVMEAIHAGVQRYPAGRVAYLENRPSPFPLMQHAFTFPGIAAVFVLVHEGDAVDGRSVRFIERDPELLRRLRLRGGPI